MTRERLEHGMPPFLTRAQRAFFLFTLLVPGCMNASRSTAAYRPDTTASYGGEVSYAYDSPLAEMARPSISYDESSVISAPTSSGDSGGGASPADSSGLAYPDPPPPAEVHPELLAEAATASETASDARPGALMVYTAGFHVGVYRVAEAQASIAETATQLGGFVASQTDDTIVIRVPAARFFEAVERVSGTGDVLHRDVRATDVSEEFRDNDIRIRNLEAMRVRLEELLRRAASVEDALQVERELERVTVELEVLRGRQRFLGDRIALSTIAVTFRAMPSESIDDTEIFVLPLEWMRTLGLSSLLRVD